MPNLVFLNSPVSRCWVKLRRGISDFWISGESFVKENCHNSKISDDINMKLGSVTELGKANKKLSKRYNDVVLANYNVIFIFTIYSQFGAIRKPDSGRISVQLTFSLTITFYLTKTENRTKTSLTQLPHYCF